MGSCVSTGNAAGAVDEAPTSANVITLAGALRECPSYFTAADVLADDSPSCFVCNSDKLFYDEYIPQLDAEEVLRPGQLYFVLPDVKRRYPLSRSDMRELVVKASSALQLGSKMAGQTKRKEKNINVRIMPVLEVDGGQGDEEEVQKKFGDGVNLQGRRSVMAHRRMKTSGSLRGRVGFPRRRSSGATLSTITEVVDQ